MGDELNSMKPASPEQSVFAEALLRPAPEARAAYLDGACGKDTPLRRRVEALLRSAENAGDFLEHPPTDLSISDASTMVLTGFNEKPGDRIGRYKLLQQIGEGGCGVVYMAEQEEPVRRRVALKVIKMGMDTKSVMARFEAERQALALMDHPNIAKVFDAGATETGRPYFVMELVRGIKITDYCDQNNLSTEERLKLFTQVCQAIQHAHQKGIIHRDIKPSNILVTVSDPGSPGCPKVIDFGIAKATTGQRLTDKTVFTAFEQFMGTPAYMSPEQAMMTSLDIDTRTDIYALGVLLYELLTGRTPFDAKELMAFGLDAMRHIILEQEPARPSTRLSTLLAADLTTVARHRQAEPARLGTLLRGDLDWIVMKALEKDRTRRYETANGLAADIQRHLDNEPVVARPPSAGYRFQKLVRRNKLAFAAASAVATALVLGMVGSTWQAMRATRAENLQRELRQQAQGNETKAKAEAAKSQQVAQFMKDMLKGVGPSVALGRDTTLLREILDKTVERIGKDLKDQPEVEVELRAILTLTYEELWLFKQREEMARETLRVSRSRLGEEHPAVADALHQIGDARSRLDDQIEAEKFLREAVALKRKTLGNEHASTAASINVLGWVILRQNRFTEAEMLGREALAIRRSQFGNEHRDVADSIYLLGMVMHRQGRLAEAETLHREALAMQRKVLGEEHPTVAESLDELAKLLQVVGKLAESETLHRAALARRRKLFSPDHPEVAESLNNLAAVLKSQGKQAEVETLYREELAVRRKLPGNEHPDLARTLHNLALSLRAQGKHSEADPLFREAQELWRLHPDPAIERAKEAVEAEPQNTHRWHDLGYAHFKAGEWQASLATFEKCNQRGGSAWQWFFMAMADLHLGKQEEARFWFCKSIGWMDEVQEIALREHQAEAAALLGLPDPWDRSAMATAYFKQGNASQHQGEMEKARESYGLAIGLYESLAADFPTVSAYQKKLVELLARTGRQPEVEKVSRQVESVIREELARCRKLPGNGYPVVTTLLNDLAGSLRDQGKLREAEPLFREVIVLFKQLVQDSTQVAEYPIHLGHSQWELGQVLNRTQRAVEAERVFLEALQVFEKATHDFPAEPYFRQEQAFSHRFLAGVVNELGRAEEAERHYRAAIELYAALAAEMPQKLFYYHQVHHTTRALVAMLEQVGRAGAVDYLQAIALSEKVNAARIKLVGSDHLDVAAALCGQSFLLREQGKLPEAVTEAREALAIRKKLLGDEHADVAQSLHLLAWNLNLQGQHAEAEALSREEVAIWRKLSGNEHRDVAWKLADLTIFLRDQGKLSEAESSIREALAIRRKVFGNEHPDVVASFNLLADLLRAQGRLAEAETLWREELARRKKLFGDVHREVEVALGALANVLYQGGKLAESGAVWREELAMERKLSGDDHPFVTNSLHQLTAVLAELTRTLLVQQKYADAEPPARECLTLREQILPDDWRTCNARSMLGGSLLGQKKFVEAGPLLLAGYEGMKRREEKIVAKGKIRLQESIQRLVQLYEATDQSGKTTEWRKKLAEFDPAEAGEKAAAQKN